MSHARNVSWLKRVNRVTCLFCIDGHVIRFFMEHIYNILLSLSRKLEFIISLEMQFSTSVASCVIRKTQFLVFIYVTTHTHMVSTKKHFTSYLRKNSNNIDCLDYF